MPNNPYYEGPVSDHFDGTRFFVPGGPPDKTFGDLWRMLRNARTERAPWPSSRPTLPCPPPPARVEGREIRATSIGHSTFLLQTEGVNLLTDPVWAECAGPYGRFGPRRVTSPGLRLEHLPPLDAILLSHNHYDHMDLTALSKLAATHPCPVLTPLGNEAILRRHDRRIDARALDWGQTHAVGPMQVTLTPAQHWSSRRGYDRRMALWGGFMMTGAAGAVFFAGDTGYGDGRLWPEIATRYGQPRLALIPIGAYAPRWFMRDQHCDPDEAVAIFTALGAAQAIGCHWGAFRLTDEPYDEPPRRLAEALARAGVAPDRFVTPPPGGVVTVAG